MRHYEDHCSYKWIYYGSAVVVGPSFGVSRLLLYLIKIGIIGRGFQYSTLIHLFRIYSFTASLILIIADFQSLKKRYEHFNR